MLRARAENIEIEDEDKTVPMLLTDGIEYRCSVCGQMLTEDAEMCPVCKSVFVASSVIIRKADITTENKEYIETVKETCRRLSDDVDEPQYAAPENGSMPAGLWIAIAIAVLIVIFIILFI